MGSATRLVIDPILLSLPNSGDTENQIVNFIQDVLGWSQAARKYKMVFLFSAEFVEALSADNRYPLSHLLKPLLSYSDSVVDAQTICVLIRGFEKLESIEHCTGIRDILLDRYDTDHLAVFDRLDQHTKAAFAEGLAKLVFHNQICNSQASYSIASRKEDIAEKQMNFEASISDLELTGQESLTALPVVLSRQFKLCFEPGEILQILKCTDLWVDPLSEEDAIAAINLRMEQLNQKGLGRDDTLKRFRFGPQFIWSVKKQGFIARTDLAMNLIDSCARYLLGVPKNPIEEFRELEKSLRQRIRKKDRALAYRTHLTESNEGYRLMFWRCPDNIVEFANVGPKKELIIY